MIEVLIVLRRKRGATLPDVHALGEKWPHERRYLHRKELARRHGASSADVALIRSFAKRQGLTVESVNAGGRRVILSGGRRSLERAFKVRLRYHAKDGRAFHTHEKPLQIPRELDDIVAGVFGLDDRPVGMLRAERGAAPDPEKARWPSAVATLYGFPRKLDGRHQTIAIVELGGGFRERDVVDALRKQGLRPPKIDVVSVAGARNSPGKKDRASDEEVALDLQVAGATAPGARLVVYFAPDTERGLVEVLSTAVHDRTHRPRIVSISWGQSEKGFSRSARSAIEHTLQEAAALGVTVVASAGDYGSAGTPDGKGVDVQYPASSPHVLCCGGTSLSLSKNGKRIKREVVWNDMEQKLGATGGGVSQIFELPAYQARAGVPPAARPAGSVGRGIPDVAASADPKAGYLVRIRGKTVVRGGTSASTPLWAALIARINEGLGHGVGFLNPLLYGSLASSDALRAITRGDNGAYRAGPGWNPCAGFGSPRGKKLLRVLDRSRTDA